MDDEQLKIQVGDAIQLQPMADEQEQARYYVKVIGCLPGRSLLVTTPRVKGKALLVREGQIYAARLLSGNNAFGFISSVLMACNRPYPYLHLEYPRHLERMVVRRAQRAAVDIIASAQKVDSGHEGEANAQGDGGHSVLIRDLSTTGSGLLAEHPLGQEGELLTVSLKLEVSGVEQYLTLPAVIRNQREIEEEKRRDKFAYQYGVEFQMIEPNDAIVLHAFVYEKIVEALSD